jgi:hypothetical protein
MFSRGVVQNYSKVQARSAILSVQTVLYRTFQNFSLYFSSKIGKLDNVKYSNSALSLYGDCFPYEKSVKHF